MDDELHEVMYWPWGLIIGTAVTILCWTLRHRFNHSAPMRAAASLLVGCTLAPGVIEFGGVGLRMVYAFPILRYLWGGSGWDRLGVCAVSLPPIAFIAAIAFCMLTLVRRKEGSI